jgi:hypothetical protein
VLSLARTFEKRTFLDRLHIRREMLQFRDIEKLQTINLRWKRVKRRVNGRISFHNLDSLWISENPDCGEIVGDFWNGVTWKKKSLAE